MKRRGPGWAQAPYLSESGAYFMCLLLVSISRPYFTTLVLDPISCANFMRQLQAFVSGALLGTTAISNR